MKSISVELPDNLASAVESYVKAGFFRSELDVLLAALSEFVRRNRIELKERFAREDIEWAKVEDWGNIDPIIVFLIIKNRDRTMPTIKHYNAKGQISCQIRS